MSAGRILVVDDDPQIRRVMRVTLTGQGYEVDDAKSGEAALEKLRDERFDLVLLDMNMAGMGGLETCRAIRDQSEIAIIMLTVRDSESDKVEALDAGADDYVTKPYNAPELLARIRAGLRRTPWTHGPSGRLTLGSVEVDFDTRHVIARGRNVRLTPKEFDLLRYLVAHANKVLPHRELLQAVWGPDYGDQIDYLRVFVKTGAIEAKPSTRCPDRTVGRLPAVFADPVRLASTDALEVTRRMDHRPSRGHYRFRQFDRRLRREHRVEGIGRGAPAGSGPPGSVHQSFQCRQPGGDGGHRRNLRRVCARSRAGDRGDSKGRRSAVPDPPSARVLERIRAARGVWDPLCGVSSARPQHPRSGRRKHQPQGAEALLQRRSRGSRRVPRFPRVRGTV